MLVNTFREKYLSDAWNLPNALTMLRMALVPVFVALFIIGREKTALLVFLLASLTDGLDGYLARKKHQITAFGKLVDPLADKLMVCAALVCQGARGVFPWLAILIVMTKELVMIAGGTYLLGRGVVVYAHHLGKAAQFSFIIALVLSFWHHDFAAMALPIDRTFLWLAVALACAALIEYAVSGVKTLKRAS